MAKGTYKHDVYIRILRLIGEGKTRPEIQRLLNIYPQKLQYYITKLLSGGFIKEIRTYPRKYELTPLGKRALVQGDIKVKSARPTDAPPAKETVRVHAMQIVIPILKQGSPLPTKKEIPLRGWVQRILNLEDIGINIDATVEITTKHVRVYLHTIEIPRNLRAWIEFSEYLGKLVRLVEEVFKAYGWRLDGINYKIVAQHFANTMEAYDEVAEGGYEVEFPWEAEGIDGTKLGKKSRAWLDKSLGVLELETFDRIYEDLLIKMPVNVHEVKRAVEALANSAIPLMKKTMEVQEKFNQNLELHLDTMQAISLQINTMNKLLHKLNLTLERLGKGGE